MKLNTRCIYVPEIPNGTVLDVGGTRADVPTVTVWDRRVKG